MADFTPQQLEAITTIDKNVAVSAGAGSGKTRVLVERYLYILKQGLADPSLSVTAGEILAITFTRKAAAEMKERVRKSMNALSRSDADGRYFWKQQLKELEKAQITTIHSLCNRILKENPVEAALDPSFQVVEEFEGQSFLEQCIKSYFRTELRKGNEALQLLMKNYGVQSALRQLYTLVPQFTEITACGDLRQAYLDCIAEAAADKEILCSLISELIKRRTELKKSKIAEQLQLAAENLQDILDGIRQEPADYTAYDSYIGCLKKVSALKELIGDIKELQQKLLNVSADKQAVPVAEAWQQVIGGLADHILQKKIMSDFLTFDDLENLALNLLKNNEHICRKYQSKFRYIMVDEFQDTNEKQKQIVYLLCGGDAQQLKNNKLFIVGDPKQSIYRFRGADVSVFAAVRRAIKESGGREITLADNFRTVDVILEACNKVFSRLLGENKESDIYFEALAAHNSGMEKPQFLQIAYDKDTKARAVEAEAMAVAEEILKLHERGTDFKDMAVLLSAMTKCGLFTQVFDKYGLPYQVIDGKGFYEQQEVLDLLNLFAVLHNKKRSIELAGVLRSPYFGLDDETVTELFLAAPDMCLWDKLMSGVYTGGSKEQQKLLLRAAEIMTVLRRKASVLPLNELWADVWNLLHVDAVLALQENGQSRLANAKKLRQLAADFAAAKQGTLAAWLEYTDNIISLNGRETAANIDAEDAVTIMTIHKSKGLEFDTVFLPLLAARTQSDTDEIKFDPQTGLGIKVLMPDGQLAATSVLNNIRERDKELQAAEKHRQLYVAMTRAKSRLIMSGVYDDSRESKSENWFKALQQLLPDNEAAEIRSLRAEDYLDKDAQRFDNGKTAPVFDENFLQPLEDFDAAGSSDFSASSLQTYLYCQRQYFYRYVAQLPPFEESGTGAAQLPAHVRGLLVHGALEKYTGNAESAWNSAVKNFAEGNFALAKPAEELFYKYLDSELFKVIPARHQRELNFVYNEQGYTVRGIMDCLYENEDGTLTVVDYKTGKPPAADEVKLGYMLQLALYKQAAQRLLGKKVSSAQLHFLQNLSCVELGDSENHLAQAAQLFAEISCKKEEKDFSCQLASCANCPYNYLCPQK